MDQVNGMEMTIQNGLNRDLIDLLCKYVTKEENEIVIGDRLYQDLGLYGDDADEFFRDYRVKFKVNLSNINLSDYFPSERDPFLDFFLSLFKKKRKYKSLTVGSLMDAIDNGNGDKW